MEEAALRKAGLPILLVTSILFSPTDARPCSIACSKHVIVPEEGSSVPANLPAVVVALKDGYPLQIQSPVTWTDDAGVPVPFTQEILSTQEIVGRWRLLKPDSELVPGVGYTVTVSLPNDCQGHSQTRHFVAGPSKPLPQAFPTFEVKSEVVDRFLTARSGSCNAWVQAALARLDVDPLELSGFEAVAALEAVVDGVRWGLSLPGQADAPLPLFPAPFNFWKSPIELFSVCNTDDTWLDTGLEPGMHNVALRVIIPGIEPGLLSPTEDFTLACPVEVPEVTPDAATGDDASTDFDGAVENPSETSEARPEDDGVDEQSSQPEPLQDDGAAKSTDEGTESPPEVSSKGAGCAAQSRTPELTGAFWALLLMVAAVRLRRAKTSAE
jgi:hypothetical protein